MYVLIAGTSSELHMSEDLAASGGLLTVEEMSTMRALLLLRGGG
jgi:hypothetical protein